LCLCQHLIILFLLSLYPPPYIGGGGYGYIYECLFLSLFLYIRREKRARY
jgi:hypothetical protein